MAEQLSQSTSSRSSAQRGNWLPVAIMCLGLGLFANAVALFWNGSASPFPASLPLTSAAWAQAPDPSAGKMLGARGIYMMPAQIGPSAWGFYILDVDSSTVCVYRVNADSSRLRLMAARSFKNDRFLEDLNNETPTPKDVQKLIQQQRQREQVEGKNNETNKP